MGAINPITETLADAMNRNPKWQEIQRETKARDKRLNALIRKLNKDMKELKALLAELPKELDFTQNNPTQ